MTFQVGVVSEKNFSCRKFFDLKIQERKDEKGKEFFYHFNDYHFILCC